MTKKLFEEAVDPLRDQYDATAKDTLQAVGRRQEPGDNATLRAWHSTAFVLEVVVIMLFVVISMAVLCSMFGKAYQIDRRADELTHAITLATTCAENGAETFQADPADSDCPRQVVYIFDNGSFTQVGSYVPGAYVVRRTVESDDTGGGTLYRAAISVSRFNEVVYTLNVATYKSNGRSAEGGDEQ